MVRNKCFNSRLKLIYIDTYTFNNKLCKIELVPKPLFDTFLSIWNDQK